MSLVNLANVCSHLQNASKARLGLTSIPLTNLHLRLCLGLHKHGFISSVQVAGPEPPIPTPRPTEGSQALEERIAAKPWSAYEYTSTVGGKDINVPDSSQDRNLIPANPAKRRIWLGLKYWNNEPVLSEMKLVSKPTRRIWMGSDELGRLVRGKPSGQVRGLTRPGECLFLTTDRGIWEARECVERRTGGALLCRVL